MSNQEGNTPQRQGLGEIESAARNLVSLLLNSVSSDIQAAEPERPGPSQTVQTVQRPGPSVQEEMSRSFPGYFRPGIKRAKKRALSFPKQSKLSKVISLNFYLLPKNTSITPLPNEELELLQAGMGRRTVSISEDSDHAEISRILTQTYPKMEGLSGGWLLHKATGGSGRRKLVIIPPEAEGYSAKTLKSVSSGGKAIFYIVPLQESLDTSPLAPDSPHFSKMPKTTCYQCSEVMPLQMLAVHIKTCIGKLSSDEDQTSEDVWVVEDESKVSCPICYREFLKEDITLHASVCGESLCTVTSAATCADEVIPVHTPAYTPKSLEEVLTLLKDRVDTTTEFKLCVDRDCLPERGIAQWKRKKQASPVSLLKVVFIGESGIDTGALRKEFLTDMISGIETRFFEGAGSQGKNPKYSLTDLDDENFRIVGEIFCVSLAQGGPAPAFLREWCYNFLCAGEVNFRCLSKEDVMDLESSLLICRVEDAADTESLMVLADEIVSCGYTSPINHEQKDSIIRAIVLHSTTRLIPILQQLQSGMQLYGLVAQLSKNPELCKPLFVPGEITQPDADFIMMNCQPLYSEKGTSKERIERKVTNFLQDFLQELEVAVDASIADDGDTVLGDTQPLSVQKVLQWMTGQSHIPILPDEKRRFKIACHFDHDCIERLGSHSVCYPVVSACTCTVTFPVKHLSTYEEFKRIMSDAVRYGGGFFRV